MLKRLIKYDMKSISKTAVPLFIASAIISLLCCAVLYFTFGYIFLSEALWTMEHTPGL